METSQSFQWPRIGIEREHSKLDKWTTDNEWKDGLYDGLFLGLFLRDQMMESTEGINVHEDPMKRFQVGYEHLKLRVEYVLKCTRMKHDTWGVPYWSLKSRRSSIMKYGTDGDKSKLPVATNRNRAWTQQTREMDDGRRVKRRIAQRIIPRIIPQGRSIMGRDDRTGRGGGQNEGSGAGRGGVHTAREGGRVRERSPMTQVPKATTSAQNSMSWTCTVM